MRSLLAHGTQRVSHSDRPNPRVKRLRVTKAIKGPQRVKSRVLGDISRQFATAQDPPAVRSAMVMARRTACSRSRSVIQVQVAPAARLLASCCRA
jgi:hypothetical protein